MILYDDKEPSEKVKVYDRGIERSAEKHHNDLIQYRAGDVFVPKLNLAEALRTEVRDFVDSIRDERLPEADGESGLRVVRLLELACRSLSKGGVPVEVRN